MNNDNKMSRKDAAISAIASIYGAFTIFFLGFMILNIIRGGGIPLIIGDAVAAVGELALIFDRYEYYRKGSRIRWVALVGLGLLCISILIKLIPIG